MKKHKRVRKQIQQLPLVGTAVVLGDGTVIHS